MLNLVLFGPPGAGKGTQSERLIDKYGLTHLSTGDVFRANIKGETELGTLAKSYMDKGNLVPDEVTIKMLEAEVSKVESTKGFIFDGFPRTIDQAKALDSFLESRGNSITRMISLEVEEDELVTRLTMRGKESGRADDQNDSIIRNRIKVYHQQTSVVAPFYEGQGKLSVINGIGSVDDIFNRICESIDTLV